MLQQQNHLAATKAKSFKVPIKRRRKHGKGRKPDPKEIHLGLTNYYNTNYIGEIAIGNPPQRIRALFDTGSANSWVLGSECRNKATLMERHQFFDASRSRTWLDTGEHAKIFFGSGSLEGEFGKDTFLIPDMNGDSIKVRKQTFGLVQKQTTFDRTFDAIIGLAYPTMAEDAGIPLFDEMMR